MKLTTITNVSVDGVMQGLGAPDEDRRGGVAAALEVLHHAAAERQPPTEKRGG
jgi:hypothetical protein